MDSKVAIIAGVAVVAIIAAAAGGIVLMNNDSDKETSVQEMAQGFTYDGAFGAFQYNEKAADGTGSVIMPIQGSSMLDRSQIDWRKSDDAKADYDSIVKKITDKGAFAGTSPVVLDTGSEKMYVVEYNMNMPTSKFTLVYFAAYEGKTVIECFDKPLYHPNGLASDADISEILTEVMKSVDVKSVTVGTPSDALATLASKAYKGVYGTLAVKEGASAEKASIFKTNESERLATSAVTFVKMDDAAGKYATESANLLAKTAMMGAQPMVLNVTGGEYTAVQFNVKMGMSTFSLVYFAGYDGNTFVDGYSEAMYYTSFVTVDDVAELLNAVQFVLGGKNVSVALPADVAAANFLAAYDGSLSGFAAAEGATAAAAKISKANESERLATTSIEWKVVEDGKAYYEKASADLLAKPAMMGASPKAYTVEGGDVTIVQFDVKMGMSTFSLVYFVACNGNTVVESVNEALYFAGAAAEPEEVSTLVKLAGKDLGLGNVTLTLS